MCSFDEKVRSEWYLGKNNILICQKTSCLVNKIKFLQKQNKQKNKTNFFKKLIEISRKFENSIKISDNERKTAEGLV